jgi:phage shock protein PspC (stress-responsive transcriptional regulator)
MQRRDRDHTTSTGPRPLYREPEDRMIAGVCGGVAKHLGVDPLIVRLSAVALAFAGGAGLVAYLAAWLLAPLGPPAAAPPSPSPAPPVRVFNLVDVPSAHQRPTTSGSVRA